MIKGDWMNVIRNIYSNLKVAGWSKKTPLIRENEKPKRNKSCPCGSGKKYKKCCFRKKYNEEVA